MGHEGCNDRLRMMARILTRARSGIRKSDSPMTRQSLAGAPAAKFTMRPLHGFCNRVSVVPRVYKRVHDAIRMPRREAKGGKGAGILGAAADRIRQDIAIIPQFGRRAGRRQ
jgi:hypothetical protein